MKFNYSSISDFANFSTIGLVTVSWASTTESTISNLNTLRYFFTLVVFLFLVWGIKKKASKVSAIIISTGIFLMFTLYSIFMLAVQISGDASNIESLIIWFLLCSSIAGVFYLTPFGSPIVSERVAIMYIIFVTIIMFYTVANGGLIFSGFPKFIYDLQNINGVTLTYSQGISKFFGLAVIFLSIIISKYKKKWYLKLFCTSLLIFFLFLSLIGGGRGDFAVALLISLFILRVHYIITFMFILGLLIILVPNKLDQLISGYSILFDRFLALSYSLGARDVLIIDSFNLLIEKPSCVVFGCGIGFFQMYYNYSIGQYPHNVFLEFIISFGLILTTVTIYLVLLGIRNIRDNHGSSEYFLWMIMFFFLISFKSGSVVNSFLLFGGVGFILIHGVISISNKYNYRNNNV